jgi:uncharacterized caspase-like protein
VGRNIAIVVGINEYERLKKLRYAKQDALGIAELLKKRGDVGTVYLFTDDSEPIGGRPTRATHTNLIVLFESRFEQPFLKPEDNLWFFFSGHGLRHEQMDYLVPVDGDSKAFQTCITVDYITKRLSRCGANNVVVILDNCRNAIQGGKGASEVGNDSEKRVRDKGLISIFACHPGEESWEEDSLGRGIFTFALMEAMQEDGCATVQQVYSYLKQKVPALAAQFGKPRQNPYLVAYPHEKADLILVPQNAKEGDFDRLKKRAYQHELERNFELALQLWRRVNIAAQGRDGEVLDAIARIAQLRPIPEVPQGQRVQHELSEARSLRSREEHQDSGKPQEWLEKARRDKEKKELLEAEKRERENKKQVEDEQREKERLEAKRQRAEQERLEAERQRAEQERLEDEQLYRETNARLDRERLEARQRNERLASEQREKERLAAEQREKERLAAEQREKERLAAEQRQREEKERSERLKTRLPPKFLLSILLGCCFFGIIFLTPGINWLEHRWFWAGELFFWVNGPETAWASIIVGAFLPLAGVGFWIYQARKK